MLLNRGNIQRWRRKVRNLPKCKKKFGINWKKVRIQIYKKKRNEKFKNDKIEPTSNLGWFAISKTKKKINGQREEVWVKTFFFER